MISKCFDLRFAFVRLFDGFRLLPPAAQRRAWREEYTCERAFYFDGFKLMLRASLKQLRSLASPSIMSSLCFKKNMKNLTAKHYFIYLACATMPSKFPFSTRLPRTLQWTNTRRFSRVISGASKRKITTKKWIILPFQTLLFPLE